MELWGLVVIIQRLIIQRQLLCQMKRMYLYSIKYRIKWHDFCSIGTSGYVYCWGANGNGVMGNGGTGNLWTQLKPSLWHFNKLLIYDIKFYWV